MLIEIILLSMNFGFIVQLKLLSASSPAVAQQLVQGNFAKAK
jgi:hypothetical protein